MLKLARQLLLVILMLNCHMTWAAESSPVEMLQQTSNAMVAALNANKATLKSNPKLVRSLVRQHLLAKVDVIMMSRSVLGREAWGKATETQRRRFIAAFTDTVIQTYASAFASYSNETVKFYPIRGGHQGQRFVEVRSVIVRQNGPSIPVNYRLVSRSSGWKVYDINVEGVSLVQSFRSQFASQIAAGGIESLLGKMSLHNGK